MSHKPETPVTFAKNNKKKIIFFSLRSKEKSLKQYGFPSKWRDLFFKEPKHYPGSGSDVWEKEETEVALNF